MYGRVTFRSCGRTRPFDPYETILSRGHSSGRTAWCASERWECVICDAIRAPEERGARGADAGGLRSPRAARDEVAVASADASVGAIGGPKALSLCLTACCASNAASSGFADMLASSLTSVGGLVIVSRRGSAHAPLLVASLGCSWAALRLASAGSLSRCSLKMKVWRRCQLASAHESAALLLDYRHVSSARRRSDVSALVDSPRQRLLLETWRGEAQLLHLPVP